MIRDGESVCWCIALRDGRQRSRRESLCSSRDSHWSGASVIIAAVVLFVA